MATSIQGNVGPAEFNARVEAVPGRARQAPRQILCRFSFEELLQLIDVLRRGGMSMVGPRPIGDAEIHRCAEHLGEYRVVNPGLTGLWQASGRNRLSFV